MIQDILTIPELKIGDSIFEILSNVTKSESIHGQISESHIWMCLPYSQPPIIHLEKYSK